MPPIPWACPRCKAPANGHGKGGYDKCQESNRYSEDCQGFLCDCEIDRIRVIYYYWSVDQPPDIGRGINVFEATPTVGGFSPQRKKDAP